jgi:regulatory protein
LPQRLLFLQGMNRKTLTSEEALQKLRHYCAYQERCHSEVKEKMYELGIKTNEQDELMATLIQAGQLNEERFAIAFARGRFKIKQWGRIKIKYDLKQKRVSDYCIQKALKQISDRDYEKTLDKLAKEKYDSLKTDKYLARKKKTIDYLLQKGFEWELVKEATNALKSNNKN